MRLFLLGVVTLVACTGPAAGPQVRDSCFVGGCGAEVCSGRPDVVSICIYRDAFACFQTGTCERQADGQCGWTATRELVQCLIENHGDDLPPLAPPRPL
jgi:hypothetical protein